MQDPRNLSWTQFNQSRRFPLVYDCTAVSQDGQFAIPDDLFVGLYISYGLNSLFRDPGGFSIGSLTWYRGGVTLTIDYDGTHVAETTISFEDTDRKVFTLMGYENRFFHGYVVIGSTAGLEQQPVGQWFFDPADARIDPFCVRPSVEEISALYIQNDNNILGPFYGDITLAAGDYIDLAVRSADEQLQCLEAPVSDTGTEVIISSADLTSTDRCLETINGMGPDSEGNFNLVGQACLDIQVQHDRHTLLFVDTCAEPCCTCEELQPIEAQIQILREAVKSLESHMNTLQIQGEFLSVSIAAAQ